MQLSEPEYIERTAQMPISCRIVSIENSSPHWHHEYELFFVLQGSVSIHGAEGEWRLFSGDIVLFNAREIHAINQPEADNLCLVMQFGAEIFSDVYAQTSFHFELNTCIDKDISDDVWNAFRCSLAKIGLLLYEKPNGYQFFIKGRLFDFVGMMFKNLRYQVSEKVPRLSDLKLKDFDLIKSYVSRHFAEEISPEQICHDLGLSRAKLYRILREAGAESYKPLVDFYRVECAKELLRNTESSIQYIAQASGFESDSSFYRVFKELTATTPGRYRDIPRNAYVPTGVQGYAAFSMPKALDVLRGYCC